MTIRTKLVSECVKMNVLRQGCWRLSYSGLRVRASGYAWLLPVTWQRWLSHHSFRRSRKYAARPQSLDHSAV